MFVFSTVPDYVSLTMVAYNGQLHRWVSKRYSFLWKDQHNMLWEPFSPMSIHSPRKSLYIVTTGATYVLLVFRIMYECLEWYRIDWLSSETDKLHLCKLIAAKVLNELRKICYTYFALSIALNRSKYCNHYNDWDRVHHKNSPVVR